MAAARFALRALAYAERLHLPAPSVLPVAGAVVGIYSGLLAGVFSNLIALVSALPRAISESRAAEPFGRRLLAELASKSWHFELALVIGLPALAALWLARHAGEGPERAWVRRRLRILALLSLAALGLYYPLVGLSVLNTALHGGPATSEHVALLPWWATLLVPLLGGWAVGGLLRRSPETHGHGIPEVQRAIGRDGDGLSVQGGVLKIFASAVTIGSGGSAGREGPIVYGGAAIAGGVARTLGFTRRELTILLASGAGAGIAASFNAPIAGSIFALEIILREFELKVLSPIILASVSATMVGRGVMGATPLLRRLPYQMVSGWEAGWYVVLGLLCGLLAYAFVWLLHRTEDVFAGRLVFRHLGWLRGWSLPRKAAMGGLIVGALALLNPTVWGTGHHFTNEAASGRLALGFLVVACLLKLVATALTIGSGGSGGTFFPATVIGAMAGGAFGDLLHRALPSITAPGGAYALVGMGGAVAGLTRGPLTGMMMVYELTGNYQIILPLMLACTISSALCHFLVGRSHANRRSAREVLSQTPVEELMVVLPAVRADLAVSELVDAIVSSGETALPMADERGAVKGVVQLHELHRIWPDEALRRTLRARDVVRAVSVLSGAEDLRTALQLMNREDIDVLPVVCAPPPLKVGLLTRASIRRHLRAVVGADPAVPEPPVAPTEVDG